MSVVNIKGNTVDGPPSETVVPHLTIIRMDRIGRRVILTLRDGGAVEMSDVSDVEWQDLVQSVALAWNKAVAT